jgi:hypothetical protein
MAYNRRLLYTKSFPSWNTPEGNLGSVDNDQTMTPIQLVATEINEPGSTITYAVTTGSLPTGLTLSSSGEISGTPTGYTSTETINFTITATDDEGETAFRDFSFLVSAKYEIDYLVVAGGGSGGGVSPSGGYHAGGAGGGAGGYLTGTLVTDTNYVNTIIVGSGGATANTVRNPGTNSSLSNITSIGGGGGFTGGTSEAAQNGGSGGGGGRDNITAGLGTAGQGNNGGVSNAGNGGGASGGGGAGETGFQGSTNVAGNGGDGLQSSITGTAIYYAGGGGGGNGNTGSTSSISSGGLGGGGNGSRHNVDKAGKPGSQNTGGGGGGAAAWTSAETGLTGGSGGSGVVILRMPTIKYSGTTTGSPTVTTDGSDTILTYTGSGTYTG